STVQRRWSSRRRCSASMSTTCSARGWAWTPRSSPPCARTASFEPRTNPKSAPRAKADKILCDREQPAPQMSGIVPAHGSTPEVLRRTVLLWSMVAGVHYVEPNRGRADRRPCWPACDQGEALRTYQFATALLLTEKKYAR